MYTYTASNSLAILAVGLRVVFYIFKGKEKLQQAEDKQQTEKGTFIEPFKCCTSFNPIINE